ncbi:peptide deformylase [Enterococcus hulanensis]|uniref:Peptide deformylase n=1 Tax=Enterococcus hulanensis TaxID=2559929 RepID=A0ABU3EZ11_9ENTE|nr:MULTISPECIES: peptide deformylase [Enterococcus]MBO0409747.1 peptide deformylase [Enterococcus hulanensis]MBO0455207.1 peptide deformylase [Enterococcus hulanensis]MBX8937553.1 peptide deformylase [Enterococcus gilvus]MDT2600117.1 peptide deformylase [Enterococcus hulanensis]MDT2608930.1 peptide deformylase [Enterococcus hulanensis]
MRYPIIIHPDERLLKKAAPIEYITDEIVTLLDDMYETMIAHDGIGLAAPQIGKNLRIAVIEVEEGDRFDFINPEIIERKGTSIDVEGCLSIPETYGTVERADEVTVRYYDNEGSEMEVTAYGYLARAFQHEIDHLDGKLFIDQVIDKIEPEDLERYMEEHADD